VRKSQKLSRSLKRVVDGHGLEFNVSINFEGLNVGRVVGAVCEGAETLSIHEDLKN
jgi:hypothetical protein